MSVCVECGKQLQGQRRTVCSQGCYRKRVVRMNREARQRRASGPETRTCQTCENTFETRQYNRVTCSTRCAYQKNRAHMRDAYTAMSPDDKARFLADLAAKRAQDPAKYREIRGKSVGLRRLLAVSLAAATRGDAGGA